MCSKLGAWKSQNTPNLGVLPILTANPKVIGVKDFISDDMELPTLKAHQLNGIN